MFLNYRGRLMKWTPEVSEAFYSVSGTTQFLHLQKNVYGPISGITHPGHIDYIE